MNGSANTFQDVIAKLHKAIANYHEGLVRIDREFHAPKKALNADQERNQEFRKSNWRLAFAKEWERNATEIASASSQIRRHQPAFVDFGAEKPLMASEIPAGLVLGSLQVSFRAVFLSFSTGPPISFHQRSCVAARLCRAKETRSLPLVALVIGFATRTSRTDTD
jgi:hypothetical protein